MKLVLLALLAAATAAAKPPLRSDLTGQALVDYVNSVGLWKAEVAARFRDGDLEKAARLMGAKKSPAQAMNQAAKPQFTEAELKDIPAEFDSATNWPECKDVILNIADQSNCGSCWAVSSASVMSDRLCIASKGKTALQLSATDLMSCCHFCGFGCNGGFPYESFVFWKSSGLSTGGNFEQHQGCKPYAFAPCEHHNNATRYPACAGKTYPTPRCTKTCQPDYSTHPYKEDKAYGTKALSISSDEAAIQREIQQNGPVVFSFHVFEDFLSYKSGVYECLGGRSLGWHAVRCVGWGVEDGKPYWKIANSWNQDWGDNGYIKILRGSNEVQIESQPTAGLVDLGRTHL